MRHVLFLLLLTADGCRWPLFDMGDQPSVVDVLLDLCPSSEVTSLRLWTFPPEGDWSYAPFTGVRLEDMKVTTADGVAITLGKQAFTRTDYGGEVLVQLLDLPPDTQTVRAEGTFVATMEDGDWLPITITGTARPGTPGACPSKRAKIFE